MERTAPPAAVSALRERSLLFRSPIAKRRWANFKANKRGYRSLWIFLALFIVTLCSEFIANDRPIIVSYQGQILFPIFVDYPESVYGGFLATTDYRDTYIQEEINNNGWMVWPPIRYSYRSVDHDLPSPAPSPPWWTMSKDEQCSGYQLGINDENCNIGNYHWLGSDDQGRDVFARVMYGLRIGVLFGLILTTLSSVIGVIAGAVQGFYGGWIDLIFQRVLEVYTSIPTLYLLIIVLAAFTPGFWIILFVMLIFGWVALVGVVRAEFLRGRNFEYINAARALGLSNIGVMFRHLLPNAMVAALTSVPFMLASSVTALAALDFIGFGMPAGSPSLGELIQQGKNNISAPWLGLTGFFVIASVLTLLVFVGEGVRDAFDPRRTYTAAASTR